MSLWGDMMDRSSGIVTRKEDYGEFDEKIGHKQLMDMMKQGIVHFKYYKKDRKNSGLVHGPEREAWGTKDMGLVNSIPHGGDCPPKSLGYTTYFDVKKGDWRVFWEGNLIGVVNHIFTQDEFERYKNL